MDIVLTFRRENVLVWAQWPSPRREFDRVDLACVALLKSVQFAFFPADGFCGLKMAVLKPFS